MSDDLEIPVLEPGEKIIGVISILEGGRLKSVVVSSAFKVPPVWGIALADFVHVLAKAIADDYGVTESQALDDIIDIFDKELTEPTSHITMEDLRVT
jgi:hypothetical protein